MFRPQPARPAGVRRAGSSPGGADAAKGHLAYHRAPGDRHRPRSRRRNRQRRNRFRVHRVAISGWGSGGERLERQCTGELVAGAVCRRRPAAFPFSSTLPGARRRPRVGRFTGGEIRISRAFQRLEARAPAPARRSRWRGSERPLQLSQPARMPRGISKRNVLPRPGALVTETSPPCSVTMCLTIESPRPVPPSSRERALSTR